mmetsp:Transcript_34138/g.61555  ORF Transcript_34138/g.61555 Transcript_34138/m.61555 type:complete len:209 (-) Transcript_34138:448-1074(-)
MNRGVPLLAGSSRIVRLSFKSDPRCSPTAGSTPSTWRPVSRRSTPRRRTGCWGMARGAATSSPPPNLVSPPPPIPPQLPHPNHHTINNNNSDPPRRRHRSIYGPVRPWYGRALIVRRSKRIVTVRDYSEPCKCFRMPSGWWWGTPSNALESTPPVTARSSESTSDCPRGVRMETWKCSRFWPVERYGSCRRISRPWNWRTGRENESAV